MEQDMKTKIDQACHTAEEFTKLYYESVDKRRHLMSRYYLDSGESVLVWNGNGIVGKNQIQKFFMNLPASEHTLTCLDAQPVLARELIYYSAKMSSQKRKLLTLNEKVEIINVYEKEKEREHELQSLVEEFGGSEGYANIDDALFTESTSTSVSELIQEHNQERSGDNVENGHQDEDEDDDKTEPDYPPLSSKQAVEEMQQLAAS
ncbi:hypothetical protein C0J52_19420 [Blattella germanica]|nr:hypothetical protein C0J52_19420 [Blattella germanica]